MKNIHLIPTDKPSRLYEFGGQFILTNEPTDAFRNQNIYITNDEEIKEGDWFITTDTNEIHKSDWIKFHFNNGEKIILTTDQDLIADGVQAIDDEFLEWFVKNPSCEWVCTIKNVHNYEEYRSYFDYKIIIPQEEPKMIECYFIPSNNTSSATICGNCGKEKFLHTIGSGIKTSKQQTLEEASWRFNPLKKLDGEFLRTAFIKGAKWQEERMYSEEEVLAFGKFCVDKVADFLDGKGDQTDGQTYSMEELLEQFKKK
jgi:hypothetical protein